VCSGDRQLVDSEEVFAVCDKKCFGIKNVRHHLEQFLIEINVGTNKFSEPHGDLHKLRKLESVRLCPALPYTICALY